MPKIISKENTNINIYNDNSDNIRTKKYRKNQILYPNLTSGNFNNNNITNTTNKTLTKSNNNLYLINSFNK